MTRRSALSRAVGWTVGIVGCAALTVAVEGGLVGGWLGAVLAAAGTVGISVSVTVLAADLRHARRERR